jgi:hypothetical protein
VYREVALCLKPSLFLLAPLCAHHAGALDPTTGVVTCRLNTLAASPPTALRYKSVLPFFADPPHDFCSYEYEVRKPGREGGSMAAHVAHQVTRCSIPKLWIVAAKVKMDIPRRRWRVAAIPWSGRSLEQAAFVMLWVGD